MDDIDKLLAGIGEPPPPKPQTPPIEPSKPLVTIAIDDLLGSLDESLKRNVRQHLSHNLAQNLTQQPAPSISPILINPPPMDDLLSQVKIEQNEKAQAELIRQQEIELEQKRQEKLKRQRLEQLKQQRRAELRQAAEQWLKQLKPKSDEGRWFEEFACNYDSRLEAAIDYLEALEDVNDMLPNR